MKQSKVLLGAALITAATLAGCGGGGGASPPPTGLRAVADVPIPNWTTSQAASFDLSFPDAAQHSIFFTDRDNASVDQVSYATGGTSVVLNILSGGGGNFAGCRNAAFAPVSCNSASNGNSGPNGLDGIGATGVTPGLATATSLIAGDVGQLGVVSPATRSITRIIGNVFSPVAGQTHNRNDEGCFLPAGVPGNTLGFGVYAIASPSQATGAADPVFYTFVRTDTFAVIGQVTLPNSTGQEACQFDWNTGKMYYNDDGDIAGPNPDGSLDSFTVNAAFVAALAAAPVSGVNGQHFLSSTLPGGPTVVGHVRVGGYTVQGFACGPAGLTLNTTVGSNDVAVNCRPGTVGTVGWLLILDRTTGLVRASPNAGLGDQIMYDPVSRRYYNGSSRWTATGLSPNSCAASPANRVCTPRLIVIDDTTYATVARLPTGNNAHSVGVDGTNGVAISPYSNATSPAGCGDCAANGFINGGVTVFAIR